MKRWYTIIGGVLILGLAAAIVVLFFNAIAEEKAPLLSLEPLTPQSARAIKAGDQVLLDGQIGKENKPIADQLIVGCVEEYTEDTDDSWSWEVVREYNQPFVLQAGELTATIKAKSPCPRGTFITVAHDQDESLRLVGFPRGAALTVVGTIDSTDPLVVTTKRHFGGTRDGYLKYLEQGRILVYVIGGALAAIGVIVLIVGFRRDRH